MVDSSPMVVVYPRGQLTEADKQRLQDVGIIAIEADDPSVVRVLPAPILSPHPIAYDDMLMALLYGIRGNIAAESEFARHLHDRLKLREKDAAAKRMAGEGA